MADLSIKYCFDKNGVTKEETSKWGPIQCQATGGAWMTKNEIAAAVDEAEKAKFAFQEQQRQAIVDAQKAADNAKSAAQFRSAMDKMLAAKETPPPDFTSGIFKRKTPPPAPTFTSLRIGILVSLLLLIGGVALYFLMLRK